MIKIHVQICFEALWSIFLLFIMAQEKIKKEHFMRRKISRRKLKLDENRL